jgi:hypothetical protein
MSQHLWQNPLTAWFSDIRHMLQVQAVFVPTQGLNINQGETFEVEVTITNLAPQPTIGHSAEMIPHIRFFVDSLSVTLSELEGRVEFVEASEGFKRNDVLGGYSMSFSPALAFGPGQSRAWKMSFKAKDNYVIPLNVSGNPGQQKHIQTLVECRLDYEQLFRFIKVSNAEINIAPWWGED